MTHPALKSGRSRRLIPILAFNAAYLLAAIAGSIASGNSEFILYIVIMLILGSIVWFADRRVVFSPLVLWGLSGWGLVHMAGDLIAVPESWPINGEHRVLYSLWLIPELLKYDHVVHAFGFGCASAYETQSNYLTPILSLAPDQGLGGGHRRPDSDAENSESTTVSERLL